MDTGERDYQLLLSGDERALVRLIEKYKDGLMLYINGIVSDWAAAEELTEDTFLKLVLKKPRFSARSGFKTWLYTIGRNLALDHLRRNKNGPVSCEELSTSLADGTDLEREYIQRHDLQAVHKAMQALKAEYRQVLWLVYFEGFRCSDVGRIMKKSTHSVEVLVSRARGALKRQLMKEGFEYENF